MTSVFRFHTKKGVQATAMFLKLHNKHIQRAYENLGLLNMLIIDDRIALRAIAIGLFR